MRGLSATDDDILRRMFVISVSASGHFLWFLLCLERSCGRRVCLPVPTCGHAILCVSGKCRRQRQVSAIWSRRAQRATVCPLGQWPTLPHCCHLSRWRGCALPCASACAALLCSFLSNGSNIRRLLPCPHLTLVQGHEEQ